MCDFKPGDEVVCVNDDWFGPDGPNGEAGDPRRGGIYIVVSVSVDPEWGEYLKLAGCPAPTGYEPSFFRKVQRRDLTAWLATENTIEEPKRVKVDA